MAHNKNKSERERKTEKKGSLSIVKEKKHCTHTYIGLFIFIILQKNVGINDLFCLFFSFSGLRDSRYITLETSHNRLTLKNLS